MKSGAEIVAAGATCPTGPTKYTPETLDTLLAAIADGLTINQSCVAARISKQCFREWRERFPEFAEALEQAREQARQNALATIKAAGAQDWRAAEAFLKLSFQKDYRAGHNTNVQVNTGTQLICDEETRQRLIALRREILAPKKVEAIEVEVEPAGLLAPTSSQTFKPAEPLSEAELAEREKKVEKLEREAELEAARQEQENCLVEPHGLDHPALKGLGLGPK